MLLTDLRRDYVHTFLTSLNAANIRTIVDQFHAMEAEAADNMAREGFGTALQLEHLLDLRYQGQEHTVKVAAPLSAAGFDATAVANAFHDAYEKLYTYRLPNPIQVVNFHLVARAVVPKPSLPIAVVTGRRLRDSVIGTRRVDFDLAGILETTIYNGAAMEPGMQLEGPAVIQEPAVTLVVPPGERVTIDSYGNYHVELQKQEPSR
jgi:N-methylhydantoinase A